MQSAVVKIIVRTTNSFIGFAIVFFSRCLMENKNASRNAGRTPKLVASSLLRHNLLTPMYKKDGSTKMA